MVGRGVLLDVPKEMGMARLEDGYGIIEFGKAAKSQQVEIKRGDYVIVRTGQMEEMLKTGSWDGYPGGDAPGFAFETLEWLQEKEISAIASILGGVRCDLMNRRRY